MVVKVPRVKRCCFWIPLRSGIILFAYINIILSVASATYLFITTELQKASFTTDSTIEAVTTSVLFSLLGMGVILNFLLLIAGYQKDISMLRLYNYYALPTILAALIPTSILLSRGFIKEVALSLFAIGMQVYVMVLVRSEVIKLENSESNGTGERPQDVQENIVILDDATLI